MKKTISLSLLLVFIAANSFAGNTPVVPHHYKCVDITPQDRGEQLSDIALVITGENVQMDLDKATFDPTYAPRRNIDYKRYLLPSTEGKGELLIQDKLLGGAHSGFIKFQKTYEGFYTAKFFCEEVSPSTGN